MMKITILSASPKDERSVTLQGARLLEKFSNKNIAIKTALLDQSVMSGLGNIYVDEVLFETKIHPQTPAKFIKNRFDEETSKEFIFKFISIIMNFL